MVDLVTCNPLYRVGSVIDGEVCPEFARKLRGFLETKPIFSSLPLEI
jgi:hypothetical protein